MIRLPAGIRRADGRALGGRFVAINQVPALLHGLDSASQRRIIAWEKRETKRAATRFERAAVSEFRSAERGGRDLLHRQRVRRSAEQLARQWRKLEQEFEQELEQQRAAAEPRAKEWNFGVYYKPRHGTAAARRTSSVDVSILIRRTDNTPMNQSEAASVMSYIRRYRVVPDGYELAGIDWRSPNSRDPRARTWKGWQTGALDADFDNFHNVFSEMSHHPGEWTLRMGGLKE